MANLMYTVGAPRSGKSTAIKTYWSHLRYTHVCVDDFRLTLYGKRWWRQGESTAYNHAYVATRALLKTGNDVIYDDTNTSETSLRRIWEIDPEAKPIVFLTPTDVCKKRATATDQEDLFPVIERCNDRLFTMVSQLKNEIITCVDDETLLAAYLRSLFKYFSDNTADVIELTVDELKKFDDKTDFRYR